MRQLFSQACTALHIDILGKIQTADRNIVNLLRPKSDSLRFQILMRMILDEPAAAGSITGEYNATVDPTVIDAPAPRPDQLPMGSSRNTWPNIVNNKRTIIFCTTQFSYLKNRENCIHDFTGGPLLA